MSNLRKLQMINYKEILATIQSYKIDISLPMESITFEVIFNRLTSIQGYRSSVVNYLKDAYMEKADLHEIFRTNEVNYENHVKYLITTDEKIRSEAKSDKAREALADMNPNSLLKKKNYFESEKALGRCEMYIKVLQGYLSDLDKQADSTQQQIYLLNLDLKINPDKIKLL